MKITIKQLRKLVREELERSLEEDLFNKHMDDDEKKRQEKELEDLPNDLPDFGIHGNGKRKEC